MATESAGTAATRQRRGEAVRRSALDAATAELIANGIADFSLPRVAERAGLNPTSVYRRWKTRENLIVEALLDASDEHVQIPDEGDLRTDLRRFVQHLAEYLTSPLGRALARAGVLSVSDERLRQARARFWSARLAAASSIIDRAIERGELPEAVDRALCLELLVAPLHLRVLVTGARIDDEFAARIADTVIDGLRPRAD